MPESSTGSSTRSCLAALPSSVNTGATIKAICSASASISQFPDAKSWSDASRSPGARTRISQSPFATLSPPPAARRQIEDHARIHRGEVKLHSLPDYGRIIRLFPKEDYGFIAAADSGELYFHRNLHRERELARATGAMNLAQLLAWARPLVAAVAHRPYGIRSAPFHADGFRRWQGVPTNGRYGALALFHAVWSSESNALKSAFAHAAVQLEPRARLASIDGAAVPDLTGRLKVVSYPTLLFTVSRAGRSTSSQSAMRCVLSHSIPKAPRSYRRAISPMNRNARNRERSRPVV
jgi:hypothetical protein